MMPTRAELFEETLGLRWRALARREGHQRGLPSNTKPAGVHMNTEAKAATLLRTMRRRPKCTVRSLASEMNTTVDDVNRRMMFLQREGRVRLINKIYEVIE